MSLLISKHRIHENQGFALLVTIVLVSFLVLILVALATFSRVETQVADNSQQLAKARQNALMALNIAVGQLQKHAGPDARISVRGDWKNQGVGQPYLTGIWNVNDNQIDTWLISGNDKSTVGSPDVESVDSAPSVDLHKLFNEPADADGGAVSLVDENSAHFTTATDKQRILVEKEKIQTKEDNVPGMSGTTNITIGHYAYWVGDEGMKASIALTDAVNKDYTDRIDYDNDGTYSHDWGNGGAVGSPDTNQYRKRLNQLSLVRPRLELVLNNPASNYDENDVDTINFLPRIISQPQMRPLPNATASPTNRAEAIRRQFHNLTPLSEAVIVNLVTQNAEGNSPLKKDLSPLNESANADMVRFMRLRPENYASLGETDIATYHPKSTNGTDAVTPVAPVVTDIRIRAGFNGNALSGATNMDVKMEYIIEVEFWNPYAATIVLGGGIKIRIENLPIKFTVKNSGGTSTPEIDISTISTPLTPVWTSTVTVPIVSGVTVAPGEVKTISGGITGLSEGGTSVSQTIHQQTFGSALSVDVDVNAVDTPAVTELIVTLQTDETTPVDIQRYTTGRFNSESDVPAGAGYSLAYGFSLVNNLQNWTNGNAENSSGNAHTSADPRSDLDATNAEVDDLFDPPFTDTAATPAATPLNASALQSSGTGPDAQFAGYARMVLFDLPRQEVTSVGMLTHMKATRSYAVGNRWGGSLNGVFDEFFVSTIPQNYDITDNSKWTVGSPLPLPNRYIRPYLPQGQSVVTESNIETGIRAYNQTARYLMIKGAFNINSTSEDAWAMLLGSTLSEWEFQSTSSPDDLDDVFFRISHNAQALKPRPLVESEINTAANILETSGRQLRQNTTDKTHADVKQLAKQIVARIRKWSVDNARPFVSLTDFLNSGVIEDAINYTSSKPGYQTGFVDFNAGITSPALDDIRNAPGALTQADIIASMAQFIAVRSDTFLIRAYGDVRNPITEEITSRAWCEATVQRVPDLTRPTSGSYSTDAELNPPTNYQFGRQFKIISFRWLSTDDI